MTNKALICIIVKVSLKRGYYDNLRIKEEEKRKAEEPMSTSTKVILAVSVIIWILITMAMCK